ncbi:MAG: hypothetical protein M1830_009541 [Pleopsidium flavum]|nr:MAG: hypothetical protein M1830_009541 [Pleopsidium flavum]
MSKTTRDLLSKVQKMVPPMLEKFHKGQLGRVAVIGGSQECVAISQWHINDGVVVDCRGITVILELHTFQLWLLRAWGPRQSHVICEPEAAQVRSPISPTPSQSTPSLTDLLPLSQVIKTYSPNLMVHPYMRQSHKVHEKETQDQIFQNVIDMIPRVHVIVIGPGLGRDSLMHETCARVITEAKKVNMPFVLDADGLYLAQTRPELVQGYKECILTPNVVEFGRLAKSKGVDVSAGDQTQVCAKLAKAFGGVTIIQKGGVDYISNGEETLVSDLEGGLKRSGGQGDTLTGSLGTLLAYRKAYMDRIWDHENDLKGPELLMLAAFGGSSITRECSRLAFKKQGRSLQASDLTEQVPIAFNHLIGEKEAAKL